MSRMFLKSFRSGIGVTGVLFVALVSHAHSRLYPQGSFPPRNTSSGIKTGPCGGDPAGTPVVFKPGQVVTVQWEETIKHTGEFRFFFATANDTPLFVSSSSTVTPLLVVPEDPNKPAPAEYSAQITLPNTPCDACTLQLIQVMLDNHPTAPTYYFSCADVKLTNAATPTPSPSPGPSATPPPSPTPVPTACP